MGWFSDAVERYTYPGVALRIIGADSDARARAANTASTYLENAIPGDTFVERNWLRFGEAVYGARTPEELIHDNVSDTTEAATGLVWGGTSGAIGGALKGLGVGGTLAVLAAGGIALAVVLR